MQVDACDDYVNDDYNNDVNDHDQDGDDDNNHGCKVSYVLIMIIAMKSYSLMIASCGVHFYLLRVNKFPRKMSEMASNVRQLPKDLRRAFEDKRWLIEKYAPVSDLLNQCDLMEHFPSKQVWKFYIGRNKIF